MILRAMQQELAASSGDAEEVESSLDGATVEAPPQGKQLSDSQQRRLSLMTALKVSLEKVSLFDAKPERKRQEPMSVEEICRCTYDLLSEASEL
jgi:hypothetical protein